MSLLLWLVYIPLGTLCSFLVGTSLYWRFVRKLSIPAQITRLVFQSFMMQGRYWTGFGQIRKKDPSLKDLSEEELGLIVMMDTLIGKFDSDENKVPVDNDFMDKKKPLEEILKEVIAFRKSLPEGIHQSKAGPFYFPTETIHFRSNHENPNKKHPSIYFNFHDLKFGKEEGATKKRTALLHLHGGGYMMGEPSTCYTMENVCSSKGFDLLGVDYSLFPENTVEEAIEDAFKAYNWLVNEKKADYVYLWGESAGGHLAIMLCDRIAQEKENIPEYEIYNRIRGVIGFSPWCDVSMSSVGMNDPNHVDRALPNKALNQFKKWGLPLGFNQEERAKKLSPIHFSKNRIQRLKTVTNRFMFSYSTNERLFTEIETFQRLLKQENFKIQKHVVFLPFHCFHVFCDFIPVIFGKLENQMISFIEGGQQ